jgi:hypothetical protein
MLSARYDRYSPTRFDTPRRALGAGFHYFLLLPTAGAFFSTQDLPID